ncbi:MAG: sugar phosphate isomerase/epimerase [Ignavibacteriales bacterium]|nr:sugar phosphate isomerase/epimerase [Ignavibacteriales bacterium]
MIRNTNPNNTTVAELSRMMEISSLDKLQRTTVRLTLGIVNDEISLEFNEALRYGAQWGIHIYELRSLKSGRVPTVDPSELQEVINLVRDQRITISALSPGIFKHPLTRSRELEEELSDTLPRTIELAKRLTTRLILVFGFQRSGGGMEGEYQTTVNLMRRAANLAEKEDMRLAIENEPGFWCDSGKNTAKFIQDVGSASLGANWDPCNGYGTDERPFPEGYNAIKDFIFNVHVKDTQKGSLIKCVPVGEGAIDWKGQLKALVKDKIVQHVTIETHCLPLIEKSKQNVETLSNYIEEIMQGEKVTQ